MCLPRKQDPSEDSKTEKEASITSGFLIWDTSEEWKRHVALDTTSRGTYNEFSKALPRTYLFQHLLTEEHGETRAWGKHTGTVVRIQGVYVILPIFTCWKPGSLFPEPESAFSLDIHNLRIARAYLSLDSEIWLLMKNNWNKDCFSLLMETEATEKWNEIIIKQVSSRQHHAS